MNKVHGHIKFALVALLLLAGCDGEGTLLELYPLKPIVNPEVRTLIQDNRIIHAELGARNQISGITAMGSFETVDRFKSFTFEPHHWPEEGLFAFGVDLVVRVVSDGPLPSLRYSRDNGKTWLRYEKALADSGDPALGEVLPVKLTIAAENVIWLLCQQRAGTESVLQLYQVDLIEGTHKVVLKKRDAKALTFAAIDRDSGWVLWEDPSEESGGMHILKTTDGGRTWSDGAALDRMAEPLLEVIDGSRLLVFGQAETVYHSADGGATFKLITTGMGAIRECQAVTADRVYLLSAEGRLAKSTDGGLTWSPLATQAGNTLVSGSNLSFQHEQRGIVYDIDRMFITEDGGERWDVLIYPYDYVVQ